jgi:hypothetical protein
MKVERVAVGIIQLRFTSWLGDLLRHLVVPGTVTNLAEFGRWRYYIPWMRAPESAISPALCIWLDLIASSGRRAGRTANSEE